MTEVKILEPHASFLFSTLSTKKVVISYGGAGSGKSYSVAQFLILLPFLCVHPVKILVLRKTNPSLRLTAYSLILEMLQRYDVQYEHFKIDQRIRLPDSSEIVFRGMDNPERIKSAEFNVAWLEEANEFTFDDYQQVRLRLRYRPSRIRDDVARSLGLSTPTKLMNKLILTFNPVDVRSWIYRIFFEKTPGPEVAILRTTYKDNPFLDETYKADLEQLKEVDDTYYRVYALGEFALPKSLIYDHYRVVDHVDEEEMNDIIYGLDFGYNNPTACVKVGLKKGEVWVLDELYQSHLTNADLIGMLKEFVHSPSAPIYCDSAEPQRIEEIRRAGLNALPAQKNVKMGIDLLKRHRIFIANNCSNTIKEISMYKWKEDRAGNILDEPVKFMDHAMDALRYAVYTYSEERGLLSSGPSIRFL